MLREEEICETLINPCKNSDLVVARGCAVHFCAFWGVPGEGSWLAGWLAGWLGWLGWLRGWLAGWLAKNDELSRKSLSAWELGDISFKWKAILRKSLFILFFWCPRLAE